MSFELKPAKCAGIIPLLALWGSTGGGKTESALRLARGMAGENGRVGVIDTEGRRASYFADRIPGGFSAIDFSAPYSPERYVEALCVLEKNCDAGVLDSATHCWEGPDGILDLHEQALDRMLGNRADDWKERERMNWPAWREPKQRYKVIRQKLLSLKIPLVICFRGEEKSHMEKVEGRNTVVTDKTTSPIFHRRFIFEVHVAMEVFQKNGAGGFIRFPMPYAKTSHPGLRAALPDAETAQLGIEHGDAIARWCSGSGSTSDVKPVAALSDLKRELWKLTTTVHQGSKERLESWIIAELKIAVPLDKLEASGLQELIEAVRHKLKQTP